MKYYLYISDAKVDMLLPQVPHPIKRKTATELGFNFTLLKGSRKTEEETEETRISRLETVVDFIREYGNVGSLDEPEEFIEGTATVGATVAGQSTTKVAYFGGKTDRTVFGLVGSAAHLLSRTKTTSEPAYHSEIGEIIGWLKETAPTKKGRFSILRSISFLLPNALGRLCLSSRIYGEAAPIRLGAEWERGGNKHTISKSLICRDA